MLRRLFFPPLLAVFTLFFLAACEDSEERAERHYQTALELLADDDVERALVELQNVIKFDAAHKKGRLLYAQTLQKQGRSQEAVSQFLRVAEQHPNLLDARLPLTRMLLELNEWEEALRHGRAAQKLAPQNTEVVFLNAVLDYREGIQSGDMFALDTPLEVSKAKLAVSSTDRLAWRLMIDHAVTTGNSRLALQNVENALTHLPEEFVFYVIRLQLLSAQNDFQAYGAALQDMTSRFPEDMQTRAMLLAWYKEQGDTAGAEAFLRKLATDREADPVDNLRVVDFLHRTHGSDSAHVELDRLISEAPENIMYLATRAALDFEEGKTDAAIAVMKDLLDGAAGSEKTANLNITLARMLVSSGDVPGAKALIKEVLLDTQHNAEALKMHAVWQIEDGRSEEAILTLRTAQARAPRDPEIMYLIGWAHERSGARELAAERYALAVEASGSAPRVSVHYADFLLQDNRLDAAEGVLEKALSIAPGNINLLTAMADIQLRKQNWGRVWRLIWKLRAQEDPLATAAADRIESAVLLQQHDTEDAIAFLGGLVKTDEKDTAALSALITLLVQNNEIDSARTILDERLQQEPENPDLRLIRARLHMAEGETEQAEKTYRVLLEEVPDDVLPLRQLNRILVLQGREDDLSEIIDAALAARPDAILPKLLRAEQLERRKDFEGAISLYEDLYAENTSNLIFANNLASLISTHRDDEESLARAYTVAKRLRESDVAAFQDTYG
ncbi:MAG: tetratricopeptide repeat protein, partial [Hyphomicrobiales bacterium]